MESMDLGDGEPILRASPDGDCDELVMSSSAPNEGAISRNSRLARKAESARQARLRHKHFVTDLQEQAAILHARIRDLEAHCTSGPGSAAIAFRELKCALSAEQLEQLRKWLSDAQGDDNVLARYENVATEPPPLAYAGGHRHCASASGSRVGGTGVDGDRGCCTSSSAPIAIGTGASHWRDRLPASPMVDSDDGDAVFPLSRSWDDCEVARSILYLNSPNGFHPVEPTSHIMPLHGSFVLPSAASPDTSFVQPHGSMLPQKTSNSQRTV